MKMKMDCNLITWPNQNLQSKWHLSLGETTIYQAQEDLIS
jgi:hypothetical protein